MSQAELGSRLLTLEPDHFENGTIAQFLDAAISRVTLVG